MADKVQNVRINFITGPTPELQRAEALLAKAQQSTDRLNQATQNFNRTATTGGKQVATTIDGLVLKQQQLAAQIRLTSTADTKRLQDLSTQYKALTKQIQDLNKQYLQQNNAIKSNAAATQSLTTGFGNLFSAIKSVVAAGIVKELVDMSLNMARLSGNVESVSRAFNRLPGARTILQNLKEATHGTVTEIDLMQRALRSVNFGISLQALPDLLEFASVRAQQTGVSVDYLVNSIVDGIGRKSLRVLDNLQIAQSRIKEQLGGISLEAATVAQVSEAMGRIASEELQKMGGYAETSATKVEQLDVKWEKLRVTLSQRLSSSWVIDFLTQATEGLDATAQTFSFNILEWKKNLDTLALSQKAQADALKEVDRIQKEAKGTDQERIDFVQQEINSRVQLLGRYNDNINALKEERKELQNKNPYDERIESLTRSIRGYNDNKIAIAAVIIALKDYLAMISKANAAEANQVITIEKLREQLKLLREQREDTAITDTAEIDRLQRLILLKEDEILKVSDRIEWEKKWGQAQQVTAAIEKMRAEDLEELNKKIADFANIDLSNLEQNATKVKAFFSAFGLEDTEGTVKALEDNIEFLRNILEPLEDVDFSGIEIEPEVAINPQITNESRVRFRIRLREILGSDMVDAFIAAQEELKVAAIDIISEQLMSIEQAQIASLENQLSALSEYYDEQQILAGDNERYKDELRLEEERKTNELRQRIAEKEKKARRFSIIIDTAAGIMRAFATLPTPAAIVQSLIIAAQGASQLAIVNRQPAKFAKGVIDLQGPGTTTSDSIPARLSRRESVMTAEETVKAKGILTDIRAKRLDDRVMDSLRKPKQSSVYVFNDERIISELREMRKNQPDIIEQYGTLYKVSGKGTALQKRIRAKRISG